jgi:hypothetical protein
MERICILSVATRLVPRQPAPCQGKDGSVTWAGLQDSGFHKGMEFTNVFRGSLGEDGYFHTR